MFDLPHYTQLYTSTNTVQNGVWHGTGNPPGRAICRDAVGTGKNG